MKTSYSEFIKTASTVCHNPPTYVVKAAYALYTALPNDSASIVLQAYKDIDDSAAKLAFEIVGATLVKESSFTSKVLTTAFHPATMLAGSTLIQATEKKPSIYSGTAKEVQSLASKYQNI